MEKPYVGDYIDETHYHVEHQKALKGCVADYKLTPRITINNEGVFLQATDAILERILKRLSFERIPLKWSYKLECKFIRENAEGEVKEKLDFLHQRPMHTVILK